MGNKNLKNLEVLNDSLESWFNGKLRITKNPRNSESEYTKRRLSQPFYLYPDYSKDNKYRMFKLKF